MKIKVILTVFIMHQILIEEVRGVSNSCKSYDGTEKSLEEFEKMNCAICYYYIYVKSDEVFKENQKLTLNTLTWELDNSNENTSFYPNYNDKNSQPYSSFKKIEYAEKWVQCCKAATNCCQNIISSEENNVSQIGGSKTCPTEWDIGNSYCWESAPIDTLVEKDCPDHHTDYILEKRSPCKRFMTRQCLDTGIWKPSVSHCKPFEFHRSKPGYNYETDEVSSNECCRTERGIELSLPAFKLDTCARCYKYLPLKLVTGTTNFNLTYDESMGQLYHSNGSFIYADVDNTTGIIYDTIVLKHLRENWKKCCLSAVSCCQNTLIKATKPMTGKYCPKTWDGWECFDDTEASTSVIINCPSHVYNFGARKPECTRQAEKKCNSNGTWFINWDRRIPVEYTDYSFCNRIHALEVETWVSIYMFIISMLALIPALIIFHAYSQLRVVRIKMHVQLFTALFMNCFLSAIFKGVFVLEIVVDESNNKDSPIVYGNGAGCKILSLLTKYFRLASYMWMLCEGFYLHNLITASFSEHRSFKPFYIIGWVFPIIPVIAYAIVQATVYDELCWAFEVPPYNWILHTPSLISLILNMIFLCRILYILVTKLRAVQSNEPSHFRKTVRATVILLPIFGVHYILVLYPPKGGTCLNVSIANYSMIVVDGLQGLMVAIIYCYINAEIMFLLKRTYDRHKTNEVIKKRNQKQSRLSILTNKSGFDKTRHQSNDQQRQESEILTVTRVTVTEPNLPSNNNNKVLVTDL